MKNRKAISPVLATVILIAITLVAAVAIAGFVFNLFGNFQNQPQLSVPATGSCSATSGKCSVMVYNSGSVAGQITGVSSGFTGLFNATFTGNIPSNTHFLLHVTATPSLSIGQTITGYFTVSSGPTIAFTATVS